MYPKRLVNYSKTIVLINIRSSCFSLSYTRKVKVRKGLSMEVINFNGISISINEAAKLMNKSPQYIRQGMIMGILPIGSVFKSQGSTKYSYYISPKKFYEFTGIIPEKEKIR